MAETAATKTAAHPRLGGHIRSCWVSLFFLFPSRVRSELLNCWLVPGMGDFLGIAALLCWAAWLFSVGFLCHYRDYGLLVGSVIAPRYSKASNPPRQGSARSARGYLFRVSPPIRQAFAANAFEQLFCPHRVINPEFLAMVITEVKFSSVAV
jgi:hypothetical protein